MQTLHVVNYLCKQICCFLDTALLGSRMGRGILLGNGYFSV